MKLYYVESKPTFRDMTEVELYGIEKIIDEMHDYEEFDYTCKDLGLAYTSSGGYPMYNCCNGGCEYEGSEVSHFAISENGRLYMLTMDDTLYCIE